MFTPAADVCLYCPLVVFNQEADDCYWSALLVALSLSLSVTHTHALTHTLDIESGSRVLSNWVSL